MLKGAAGWKLLEIQGDIKFESLVTHLQDPVQNGLREAPLETAILI